jgi:drug/metabolite transporter (DMT)-like permease
VKNTHRAVFLLTMGTMAWGLSFCTAKAAMQTQAALLPGHSEWFHAAFVLFNRMWISTVVMLVLLGRRMRGTSRKEWLQGLELGLFGGIGMLLQTDAQNYMPASTSAFFTQFTCIFVPVVVAIRSRRLPPWIVMIACGLVLLGCVILSGVELGKIGFGRGEWETCLAALFFTGQILSLERPSFRANDMARTATIMYSVKAAVLVPFVLAGGGVGWGPSLAHPPLIGLTLILALACTVFSYGIMTRWQPEVSATQAGIIYATEPVFASLWAVFLPGWYSVWAGIQYENEHVTWQLFAGGGLMLLANVLLIFRPGQPPHGSVPPAA